MTYGTARMNQRIAYAICLLVIILSFCHDFTLGFRYPWSDEWDLVPMLTGAAPVSMKWLWAQHNEHRIVIPKLVYLLSFNIVPDFKVPILLTLVAMGGCSFVMMAMIQRLSNVSPLLLLVFPMLLLNMTLGYHHWGFHIQFGSSTLLLCLLLSSIAYTQSGGKPSMVGLPAIATSAILLFLPLCGMNGVLPSFVLIPYFLLRGGSQAVHADTPRSGRWGKVICVAAMLAGAITGTIFVGYHSIPHAWSDPDLLQFVAATMHVLSAPLSFGPAGLAAGVIVFFLALFVGTHMLGQMRHNRSAGGTIDWCKGDLLAFIAAMLILAFGLGWGRGGRGWPHEIDGHYSLLMVPLLCALFTACLLNGWIRTAQGFWLVTLIMFCFHGAASVRFPLFADGKSRKIDRSIEAGADLNQIVAWHTRDLFFEDSEQTRKVVGRGLVDLKRYFIQNAYQGKVAEIRE